MWTRKQLKDNAKIQMKNRYFPYLGISLIPQIAGQVAFIFIMFVSYIVLIIGFFSSEFIIPNTINETINPEDVFTTFFQSAAFFVSLTFYTIGFFAVTFLLLGPMIIGMYRWYLRSREQDNISVAVVFSSFKKGKYFKNVLGYLYFNVFIYLWSLLFIIPGIIKAYSYSMVPFILADNPEIGAKRALKLSCNMTSGNKFRIFLLDLSFAGWFILGYILCGIGIYAVFPYYHATRAELYDVLKKEAVNNNYCTMEELGYRIV